MVSVKTALDHNRKFYTPVPQTDQHIQILYLHCAQKCSKSSPMRTSPVLSAYLYIALSAMKGLASGMRKDTGKVAESLILSSLAALRDG